MKTPYMAQNSSTWAGEKTGIQEYTRNLLASPKGKFQVQQTLLSQGTYEEK